MRKSPEQAREEFETARDALIVQVRLYLWGLAKYLRLTK